MLAFLPWEKLPAWLLGPILVISGIFQLLYVEFYSWNQLGAALFVIIGVGMFIRGVKKLAAESTEAEENQKNSRNSVRDKNVNELTFRPDFGKYNEEQLRQILTRIDVERFPDRVEEINLRLANFRKLT